MGTSGSRDISKEKEDLRAAEEAVFGIFSPIFLKSFAMLCLEASKDALGIASPFQEIVQTPRLLSPPLGDAPLATGWMQKLGDKNHSWKRRFFVLKNQSLNFVRLEFAWMMVMNVARWPVCPCRHWYTSRKLSISII
jgi:hypothetical protein